MGGSRGPGFTDSNPGGLGSWPRQLVLIWPFVGILIRQTSADGFAGRYPVIIGAVIASLVIYVVAEVAINCRRRAMAVLP